MVVSDQFNVCKKAKTKSEDKNNPNSIAKQTLPTKMRDIAKNLFWGGFYFRILSEIRSGRQTWVRGSNCLRRSGKCGPFVDQSLPSAEQVL